MRERETIKTKQSKLVVVHHNGMGCLVKVCSWLSQPKANYHYKCYDRINKHNKTEEKIVTKRIWTKKG